MDKIKDPTVGQMVHDILKKEREPIDPIEFAKSNIEDYHRVLLETLATGKKAYPHKDFFIVVNAKHERVLQIIFRWQMELKEACPSPFYDQAVYMYSYLKDSLDLIWQIPDQKSCWKIYENRKNMDPSQYDLLNYVLQAKDGTLWKKMKKLNKERYDSPLLEK